MPSRRDLGLLAAGFAVGVLLAAIAGGVLAPIDRRTPPGVAGAHVRVNGTIDRVAPGADRLYVNVSGRRRSGGGHTILPLALVDATVPFECEGGGNLVSCTGRRSWSWVDPGTPVCVDATLVADDVPEARRVFVNATCGSISVP